MQIVEKVPEPVLPLWDVILSSKLLQFDSGATEPVDAADVDAAHVPTSPLLPESDGTVTTGVGSVGRLEIRVISHALVASAAIRTHAGVLVGLAIVLIAPGAGARESGGAPVRMHDLANGVPCEKPSKYGTSRQMTTRWSVSKLQIRCSEIRSALPRERRDANPVDEYGALAGLDRVDGLCRQTCVR